MDNCTTFAALEPCSVARQFSRNAADLTPRFETRYRTVRKICELAWRFVKWVSPQFQEPIERLEYVTISHASIAEIVDRQRGGMRRVWGKEAKFLVIGRDEYYRLARESVAMPFGSFGVEMRMGFDGIAEWRGLTVVMVPWMNGAILLPDLQEQMAAPRRSAR